MIETLDHLGIAVEDIDIGAEFYRKAFGLSVTHVEQDEDNKVAFLNLGKTHLELIEGKKREGAVGRFIKRRGEGLHHVALEVRDIEAVTEKLRKEGFEIIDRAPRKGAKGSLAVFLSLKGTHGVLFELVQPAIYHNLR